MRIINEENQLAWGLVEVPLSHPGIAVDPKKVSLADPQDKTQEGKIPEGSKGITVKGVFGAPESSESI